MAQAKATPATPRPPKRFAEQGGLAHLLELSEQAVNKKDAHFQQLLDREHAARSHAAAAKKERAQKKAAVKATKAAPTRADMVAMLREKRREKSRERKRRRRTEAEPWPKPEASVANAEDRPKKTKRVSFG